ncbi:uncharacterized protein LOC127061146, partial [Serinus canaria]|uniref:uncharacterized protein LOC127061146 n=1 Tax=Serinus canaria TaxID=9135 RepID=UPI0021CCA0C3
MTGARSGAPLEFQRWGGGWGWDEPGWFPAGYKAGLGRWEAQGIPGMRSQILFLLPALLCPAAAAPPWDAAWSDPGARGWREERPGHSRALLPVEVQCQEAQLVVTVHRDLFGTGRLVSAAELSLGPAACRHSRMDPSQKTVTFSAGLHECGSTVQVSIPNGIPTGSGSRGPCKSLVLGEVQVSPVPIPGFRSCPGIPTGRGSRGCPDPRFMGDPGESCPDPGIPTGSGSQGSVQIPGFERHP